MKILAIEFSSELRSVAVWHDGSIRGRAQESETRASHPLALVETALKAARLEREAVECVVVGIGPGSYTGIRAAISLAQGWQLAQGVSLLGISSVEGIAAQAHADGLRGKVNVVVDAQRDEFYLAGYELDASGWRLADPLRIVPLEAVKKSVGNGGWLVGPEVCRWFHVGKTVFPDAAMLGRLAAGRSDFIPGEKLAPIYLRETSFVKAPPPRALPI